jgi:APA family basic amino acid/polyamine antiporter
MQATATTGIAVQEKRSSVIGKELHIGISAFGSWMLGVGTIIGSMAWLFHAPMIARGGTLASIAAFLIGALVSLPLAMVLSELSRLVPAAGGPYVYKYLAFKKLFPRAGEFLGFSSGWLFWVALVAGYACMGCGFANLMATTMWGSASAAPLWFGPMCIVGMFVVSTGMNSFPVSRVSGINTLFTLLKFALAAGFVALVWNSGQFDASRLLQVTNPAGAGNFWSNLSGVLIFGIAAYSGLELSACASSETNEAQRNVPRAILLTLVSVAAIYVAMSVAVGGSANFGCTADGAAAVVRSTSIPATCPGIAGHLAGAGFGALFTVGVIASIIGCGIGGLLSCARIIFAIAKTGLFPHQLAKVNAQKVPANALWFQCAVMTIVGVSANLLCRCGLFSDAYTFLAEVFAFLYSFLAIFYGVSLLVLRRTEPSTASKSKQLVPAVAVIVIYFGLAFFCVNVIHQMAGLVLLLLGIPVHMLNSRQRARIPPVPTF